MLDKIQGGNKNAFNSWGGHFFCRTLLRGADKKGVGFASFLWKLRGAIFQHMPWSEWAHLNFHRLWWFLTLCFGTLLLHLNGHYVHIQVARTIHCISTNLAEIQLGKSRRIDFLPCGCAVWSGIQRLSHIVCTALTFPQNGSHVHVQVAQTRYCKAAKVAFLKFQCIRAHLVNTQQWTTILSNTSRGNMWGTVQQVLFATNVLWESQMSTSWRNTCNSTLNRSVLFVKRNSMPERTWKGTHRYMKCKGVKNVENGSAARKSTDRTDKPTKRKQMMTRRLTYLELI